MYWKVNVAVFVRRAPETSGLPATEVAVQKLCAGTPVQRSQVPEPPRAGPTQVAPVTFCWAWARLAVASVAAATNRDLEIRMVWVGQGVK